MTQAGARTFVTKASKLLTVTEVTLDDVADLMRYRAALLAEECWVPELPADAKLTEGNEREWVEHHLLGESRLLLVARIDGELVGVLNCEAGAVKRLSHHGEFAMSVAKGFREQGIGDALLRVFIDWAEANPKIEKVSLSVLGDNERALKLFAKMKFTIQGVRRREVKVAPGHYLDMHYLERFVDGSLHPSKRARSAQ